MARLLTLLMLGCAVGVFADQPISVQTSSGAVVGRIGQTARYWKGVPYAAPPVGNLRWADSIAVAPWSTPIQTIAVSSGCPQVCDEPEGVCPDVQSEDCLYLNVYGPSWIPSGKLLPTMVFFHGGNYKIGHAGSNLYEASLMANVTNTIIVTVNYRLAALGYAVTNNLGGNYGISDQRLALKWVQSNIKFFSGDPGQVTIWGQSAGGGSVALHMISPASQGLFHRVISESNPISIEYKNRTEGITQGNLLAKFLNCLDQAGNANEDCMRRASWQDVLSAQVQVGHAMKPIPQPFKAAYPWSPSVGDPQGVVPMQPLDAILQGKFAKVPVLQGTVKEEGVQFVDMLFTTPVPKIEYLPLLAIIFGLNNTAALAPLYPVPANETKDARETLIKIATHFTFRCGNRIAARALSKAVPFFFYVYDHPLSFNPFGQNYSFCADRVCHGVELPMLYGTARLGGFTPTADEDQLTRRMMWFWGKFAYGATSTMPGPDGSAPSWPLFTEANDLNYLFDAPNVSIESHRDKMFCDTWDKVGYLKF